MVKTGETVYTPPCGEAEILKLMANLEKYSNEDLDGIDPSIKLAVIHYQFESIHPDTLTGYGRCEFLEMAGQDVAFFD